MNLDALQQLLDTVKMMQAQIDDIVTRASESSEPPPVDWPAGTVLRWTHRQGPEGKPTKVTAVRRNTDTYSWKLIGHPALEHSPSWSWNEMVALWASNSTTVLPPGVEVATDWGSFKKLQEERDR